MIFFLSNSHLSMKIINNEERFISIYAAYFPNSTKLFLEYTWDVCLELKITQRYVEVVLGCHGEIGALKKYRMIFYHSMKSWLIQTFPRLSMDHQVSNHAIHNLILLQIGLYLRFCNTTKLCLSYFYVLYHPQKAILQLHWWIFKKTQAKGHRKWGRPILITES